MKKHIIVAMLLVPALAFAQGESAAALYNRANAVYAQGQFGQAIELYEKAILGGTENSHIEYNLGNAYLKNNPPNIARAVLHYERARQLDPRDPDINYNLKYVNMLIKGKLPNAESSLFQRGWNKLIRDITPTEAIAAFSSLYFALMTALIVFFLVRGRRWRKAMAVVGAVMLAIIIIEAPVAWASLKRAHATRAVILEDELPVRSGPGSDNPELFKLFQGMVVTEKECRSGWCQVTIPNGLAGWMAAEKAEKI